MKRITISLPDKTVRDVDKLVDGLEIRSRSHAVCVLLSRALKIEHEKEA